jgi:glutathione S-transferase
MLAERLRAQAVAGSDYFVGDVFTAADLYWAAFSQLAAPMAEDLNPMPPGLRRAYQAPATLPIDPVLIAYRDRIYDRYLGLPLDF